jgi:aminoglycoside phosphotransferase (APT) family kinase protein
MFVYWPQAGEERASMLSPVTTLPGFPDPAEVAERYADRTGADLSALPWYVGFAFFKFAAIVAGIVARSAAGAMAGKDASASPTASTPASSSDAPRSTTVRSSAVAPPRLGPPPGRAEEP